MTSRSKARAAAVDVGYGYTQARTGNRRSISPSIIGPSVEISFDNDLVTKGEGTTIAIGDQSYFVGKLAQLQSPDPMTPQARERSLEIVKVLALAALHDVGVHKTDYLVTGLPVAWYKEDKDALQEALTGTHHTTINGKEIIFEIKEVKIVPQPMGAFFNEILSPTGILTDPRDIANGRIGVLDFGAGTTDAVLVDGFRFIEIHSSSIPQACVAYYALLQSAIQERYKIKLDLPDVEQASMTGTFKLWGNTIRIDGDLLTACRRQIVNGVTEFIKELWPVDFAKTYDVILVVGGGAPTFYEEVHAVMPSASIVPEPQWANVEGFYKYARFQTRKDTK